MLILKSLFHIGKNWIEIFKNFEPKTPHKWSWPQIKFF